MKMTYRRFKFSLDLDWHFQPQCPRWPQADFVEADYLDPQKGDRICGDCIKLGSQSTPSETPQSA
jgi:hypothetical protein